MVVEKNVVKNVLLMFIPDRTVYNLEQLPPPSAVEHHTNLGIQQMVILEFEHQDLLLILILRI